MDNPEEGTLAQSFTIGVDSHFETDRINEKGEHVPSGIRHEGSLKAGIQYWAVQDK